MAKKRIIAHYMHESELAAATEQMTDLSQTESYVLGDVEAADIPALEARGLIVQVLEDQPLAETPGGEWEILPEVRRGGAPRAAPIEEPPFEAPAAPIGELGPPVEEPTPPIEEPVRRRGEPARRGAEPARPGEEPVRRGEDLFRPAFYLIRVNGPLLDEWRDELEQLDVDLLAYVPHGHYTARLTPDQVRSVDALPFVGGVRLYSPADTGPTGPTRAAPAPPDFEGSPGVGRRMVTHDLRLHRAEDLVEVLDWLGEHGVAIAGTSGRKIRLYLLEDSPLATSIVQLPAVAAMEEHVPPVLHNDVARTLLGIDELHGADVRPVIAQTGDGQIVAVADTGLDVEHPDFQGRLAGVVALGRRNDYSDPHGHGTHVSGSVLGDGNASAGKIRGAAPGAKLFFQSLLDPNGGLGGLPLDLGELFEEAYQAGARIHNNSWGSATPSVYTVNSEEVDELVARRRDMLVVISAGNEGQAADRLHCQSGCVNWLSITSPASCKNALTVGASRSSRVDGGLAKRTYGSAWPKDFPEPPIAAEKISGNPSALAAFSSRGPCDDRRIKPDVVAPGTDIASAKSSLAPLRQFWGSYPGNAHYAFMGGTSMAAPLVAGCAALVREYYVKECRAKPSAALLKATLVNGTRWLTGPDAVADHPHLPNYHQGFGSLYMPWAISNPSLPELKLEFVDTWQDPARQFGRNGQRFQFQLAVSGGEWLRLCLTWTDLPARALQNNLNLFVQHLPSGQKWMGNAELPMGLRIPDPENNVEVVRLENPPVGDYLIQVSATNLLKGPQDFALVVTGGLGSGLVQV